MVVDVVLVLAVAGVVETPVDLPCRAAAAASDSDVVSDKSRRDGDWGEKDGNEVRDLSDVAIEEAELEGCEINFLGLDFALVEWPRPFPEAEAAESCDVDRSRGADDSGSMLSLSRNHRLSGLFLPPIFLFSTRAYT